MGNTRVRFTDKNEDGKIQVNNEDPGLTEVLGSSHYYPFGMQMEGLFTEEQGQFQPYQYNGIEHFDMIGHGISLATYRVHDAALGRWWQIDPEAESFTRLSTYSAMGNNPISIVDPEGDYLFLAITAGASIGVISQMYKKESGAGIGTFTGALIMGGINGALGYYTGSLTKSLSYKGFGLIASPQLAVGSNGLGIGYNVGVGYSYGNFNLGLNVGWTYYTNAPGSNQSGFEGRIGSGLAWTKGGYYEAGVNQFFSGETSQRTGYISAGYDKDKWLYTFDNDVKYFGGDGGDRFRSAGNRLKLWKDWEIGLLMYTGDPGLDSEDRRMVNGFYEKNRSGEDPDKYRLGAFYLGYKGYRFGANSEYNRDLVQNQFIHKHLTDSPFFKKLNNSWNLYYGHYSSNPYTTW